MGTEAAVQIPPDSTGKKVRTIEATTLINGVPAVVEIQVLALADAAGNVIDDFANYKFQVAMLSELRAIRGLIARQQGAFDPAPESIGPSN